jgi:hypothetical protein
MRGGCRSTTFFFEKGRKKLLLINRKFLAAGRGFVLGLDRSE